MGLNIDNRRCNLRIKQPKHNTTLKGLNFKKLSISRLKFNSVGVVVIMVYFTPHFMRGYQWFNTFGVDKIT